MTEIETVALSTFSLLAPNVRKKKLLIVDDAPTNRKFLRKLLEQRGHVCDEAENGLEALNMVKIVMTSNIDAITIRKQASEATDSESSDSETEGYDVIFMDFMMPKINGPNATRAIRELGFTAPIIGVTGNALDDDKTTFMDAGVNNVIIKPLRMVKLLEIIDL